MLFETIVIWKLVSWYICYSYSFIFVMLSLLSLLLYVAVKKDFFFICFSILFGSPGCQVGTCEYNTVLMVLSFFHITHNTRTRTRTGTQQFPQNRYIEQLLNACYAKNTQHQLRAQNLFLSIGCPIHTHKHFWVW